MRENKRVIYISRAGLPIDATGLRIDQIGKLFETCEYTLHYICECHFDDSISQNGYTAIPIGQLPDSLDSKEVHFQIGKRIYSYLPRFSGKKRDAILEMLDLFTAYKTFRRIKKYMQSEQPQVVVLYNATNILQKRMLSYCKKKEVLLLGDVTEWYEKKENSNFVEKYIVKATEQRITKMDKKMDGLISISPFFQQYYESQGIMSIQIPPLMSMIDEWKLPDRTGDEMVRFVYAGSPGSKDIIVPFVEAVSKYNADGIKCCIDIIGVDLECLQCNGYTGEDASGGVFTHGRLSHTDTMEIVRNADFGVLIRHNKRYARAGFSTKFAECMSMGVGMVCNKIGGTDLFVSDGVDGFLLSRADENGILEFLDMVTKLSRSEINHIKRNALQKAKCIFVLDSYQTMFQEFLRKVNNNANKKKN